MQTWTPWQLANDPETYGVIAGHFILTTEDGETEHPDGQVFNTSEDAQREADRINKGALTKQESPTLNEALERMIDREGMDHALNLLALIAYEKAMHIEENWQDKKTAAAWERIGDRITKTAEWCAKAV